MLGGTCERSGLRTRITATGSVLLCGYDNGYYPYPYGSGPTYGYGYYGNQGYGYYGTQRYRYGSQGYRYGWRAPPPSDASNSQTSGSPVPAPPGQRDVRWAKAASGASQQKTELPHGTPVPGKPGLVTSPFAPDSGYIDVRSFPPGTEVKDPFTGKIFLTP